MPVPAGTPRAQEAGKEGADAGKDRHPHQEGPLVVQASLPAPASGESQQQQQLQDNSDTYSDIWPEENLGSTVGESPLVGAVGPGTVGTDQRDDLTQAAKSLEAANSTRAVCMANFKRARSQQRPTRVTFSEEATPRRSRSVDSVVQRPVSNTSSDLCQLSSPPSLPGSVRCGPTAIASPMQERSVASSLEEMPARGRQPSAPARSLTPVAEPDHYIVRGGARIAVYAEEPARAPTVGFADTGPSTGASGSSGAAPAGLPTSSAQERGVPRLSAAYPPDYHPDAESLPKRFAYPPPFEVPAEGRAVMDDPRYPGRDGLEAQCVYCSDPVRLTPGFFLCFGFEQDGVRRCLNTLCEDCRDGCSEWVCTGDHYGRGGVIFVEPTTLTAYERGGVLPAGSASTASAHPGVAAPTVPPTTEQILTQAFTGLTTALESLAAKGEQQPRSLMKTSTTTSYPMGTTEGLMDLDAWLEEWDRVDKHITGGRGSIPEDKIHHLLCSWPATTDVGENMRLDQRDRSYVQLERDGNHEECWKRLLKRLNNYRVKPVLNRRMAEAAWKELAWPGDLDSFHTMLRRAMTGMRRVNQPISDYDAVLRYMDLIPSDKAEELDHPLMRPANGWPLEDLMDACKEIFDRKDAYRKNTGDGGMPRNRASAWQNDNRMASTPFGVKAVPKRGAIGDRGGQSGDCKACGGQNHKPNECPNNVAKKDPSWTRKYGPGKQDPGSTKCNRCGGSGHWAHHHDKKVEQRQQREQSQPPEEQGESQQRSTSQSRDKDKPKGKSKGKSGGKGKDAAQLDGPCKGWVEFGFCRWYKGQQDCKFQHPPDKKGPKPENKDYMAKCKQEDCKEWLKGTCKRTQCLFKHDPKKKVSAPAQRSSAVDDAPAGAVEQRRFAIEDSPAGSPNPFVMLRPTACTTRRAVPDDEIYDFNAFKGDLPTCSPPGRGYCWASLLAPLNLLAVVVRMIWDGGAEGSSISARALSRVIRAQRAASLTEDECPVKNFKRMDPPQTFLSYTQGRDKAEGQSVDIIVDLVVTNEDGEPFPPVALRMVPDQIDDVLISAVDLDKLGFDAQTDPTHFIFHNIGLATERETPAPAEVAQRASTNHPLENDSVQIPAETLQVVCMRNVALRPHETRVVEVLCPSIPGNGGVGPGPVVTCAEGWRPTPCDGCVGPGTGVTNYSAGDLWFEPAYNKNAQTDGTLCFKLPSGPIDLTDGTASILVHNPSDDELEINASTVLGQAGPPSEEEAVLAEALDYLDAEDFGAKEDPGNETAAPSRSQRTDKFERKLRRAAGQAVELKPEPPPPAARGISPIIMWGKFMLMLVGLMAFGFNHATDFFPPVSLVLEQTIRNVSADVPAPADAWSDLASTAYKEALTNKLDEHRQNRYGHLSEARFAKLRETVSKWSEVLVIDGCVSTTVDDFQFDVQLQPGAQPVRHQLPKRSPQEAARETYHVRKAESAGHLRVPTDAEKSEWATRTHVVSKKDDPNGRWICDFRPLNRSTVKRMTALGDVFSKTRCLASKRWKSGLDAVSGFNQMKNSERACKFCQIITSLGLRQWTVMPFGVTNGPSYFQEMMLHLYGGDVFPGSNRQPLPSLMGEAMTELDASLEIWIDDLQLGTGDVNDTAARTHDDVDLNDGADGFDQHLKALVRILERAAVVGLCFKLDKCFSRSRVAKL